MQWNKSLPELQYILIFIGNIFIRQKKQKRLDNILAECHGKPLHAVITLNKGTPGPEVIKLFSCSTQLSMKFVLLINLKLLTIANSFLLNIAEHETFSANEYKNANCC